MFVAIKVVISKEIQVGQSLTISIVDRNYDTIFCGLLEALLGLNLLTRRWLTEVVFR